MRSSFGRCSSLTAWLALALSLSAQAAPAADKATDAVVAEIFKQCVSRSAERREGEVCKARRPAIEQCVKEEAAAKDLKAARTLCEKQFVPPAHAK